MAEQTPTPTPTSTPELPRLGYQEVWTAAALEIIQSLTSDTTWTVAAAGPETSEPIEMVGFVELAGDLAGIQQIRLHRGSGRGWAQLVAPPPPEEAPQVRSASLDDNEREALADVMGRDGGQPSPPGAAAPHGGDGGGDRHAGFCPSRRGAD